MMRTLNAGSPRKGDVIYEDVFRCLVRNHIFRRLFMTNVVPEDGPRLKTFDDRMGKWFYVVGGQLKSGRVLDERSFQCVRGVLVEIKRSFA